MNLFTLKFPSYLEISFELRRLPSGNKNDRKYFEKTSIFPLSFFDPIIIERILPVKFLHVSSFLEVGPPSSKEKNSAKAVPPAVVKGRSHFFVS